MKVLIACERTARVRDEFRKRGHNAWSCDVQPTMGDPQWHLQCDVGEVLEEGWDLMIGHPECRYLSNSGVLRLYLNGQKRNGIDTDRWRKMEAGARFFRMLQEAPIHSIALENPVMHPHAKALIHPWPTQFIQPWRYGHPESKATGFSLKNLPFLAPVKTIPKHERSQRLYLIGPSDPDRAQKRAETMPGIAAALAQQWGRSISPGSALQ